MNLAGMKHWKPTPDCKRYKITKPAGKYARAEMVNDSVSYVHYCGPDKRGNHNMRSEILLSDKDAKALEPFLKLVVLVGDRPRIEVKDEATTEQAPAHDDPVRTAGRKRRSRE